MPETIVQRLRRDELVLIAGVGRVPHHNVLQILGRQGGFHGVWFDLEHCGLTMRELEIGTMACRASGLDCFARVPPTDYATVTRALEAGASGVMAAQMFSAEQAEQFVRWAKFVPRGTRGLNSSGWDGGFGGTPLAEFCETSNRETFVAIQIETAQAVEECGRIAAIDGVDMLFIGPADLSQSLGVTGEFWHPKCLTAIDRVAEACRTHGKFLAALCVGPEHGEMLLEKGCRMLSPTNDAKLVCAGIQAVKEQYGNLFG